MSPEQVDAYRNAGSSLHPAADWFINLVAVYGIWAVIAVGTLAILCAWLLIGILLDRHERRVERRGQTVHSLQLLERYANDPDNHETEDPRA
ncbi:hypothetical protein B0675_40160 [Streptomyces sp. M41(2017)]|uniref:hypothetical protein n=1 Tax=Streptomyces sp. M41(2017) TaxID=1955065 RepID=UPI0009BE4BB9|nr:hypothetical protein [Streptomyces sp. M41(2017)]OQQ13034.1 hypothetical protein B0675_40160 [Streptomyces sp. M41(2017)]